MARVLKWILIAAAALVVLLIAAVVAVVVLVDPNDYKDQIAQAEDLANRIVWDDRAVAIRLTL